MAIVHAWCKSCLRGLSYRTKTSKNGMSWGSYWFGLHNRAASDSWLYAGLAMLVFVDLRSTKAGNGGHPWHFFMVRCDAVLRVLYFFSFESQFRSSANLSIHHEKCENDSFVLGSPSFWSVWCPCCAGASPDQSLSLAWFWDDVHAALALQESIAEQWLRAVSVCILVRVH